METETTTHWMTFEQDQRISETIQRERTRLRNFIRGRVTDEGDVEDILQEVFYELVEAYRMMKPIEQVGAWLFRVARNRITDLFRKRKPELFADTSEGDGEGVALAIEDWLPSPEAGPEALYARSLLVEELEAALDDLPKEQREVFLAHELEGHSFKELAEASGVSQNTLLSRKHYAVVYLRGRLQAIYEEFKDGGGRN